MTLEKMHEMNKKATKALFEKIKGIKGIEIELREDCDGFTFKHKGHTYIFSSEVEE